MHKYKITEDLCVKYDIDFVLKSEKIIFSE